MIKKVIITMIAVLAVALSAMASGDVQQAQALAARLSPQLAQKVQFRVRNEMFTHMESLPISYFDQNELQKTDVHFRCPKRCSVI